ncbi:activator of basal transcription 1-like [Teleopsis dalmanni]|uniref:activator of basal transcription 1-like n=1 Tax=Teleopsis dalmanni TaxID=139649 RepID=UPI0018CF1F43|nr:activator of basal transcription 1-like [Teleopsis dalmanni]XP_037941072.1 activator of basal transcription 1-like [Teleopsis dalmanni]
MVKNKLKVKTRTKNVKKSKQCGPPPPPLESEDEEQFEVADEPEKNETESLTTKEQPITESDDEMNLENKTTKDKAKSPKKSKHFGLPPPPPAESEDDENFEETVEEPVSNDEPEVDNTDVLSMEDQPMNGNDDKNDDDDDDDDDEMDLGNLEKPKKKRKKGIVYISNIPKYMNVTRMREILGEYGKIGRVYLQPEKTPGWYKKNKRKPYLRHFTEGWVEFESKRVAKQIVPMLNNKQISTRKKSQFYDYIWTMKYLPRFKWVHLTERMNYEQAVHKQRMMNEVSQARKETNFFQNNLDKSEFIKKKSKKNKKVKTEDSD